MVSIQLTGAGILQKDWISEALRDRQNMGFANMRVKCRDIVMSENFSSIFTLVIIGNTISMSIVHHDMDKGLKDTLEVVELCFLCCFVLEVVMKILGMGWPLYKSGKINKFDFAVTVSSVIGWVVMFQGEWIEDTFNVTFTEHTQVFRAVHGRSVRSLCTRR